MGENFQRTTEQNLGQKNSHDDVISGLERPLAAIVYNIKRAFYVKTVERIRQTSMKREPGLVNRLMTAFLI